MEIRSFLAFELPGQIKDMVSQVSAEMRKSPLDVKWVKVENIHLTVIFIGNMAPERLDSMNAIIKDVCQDVVPFKIFLRGAGIFSSRRNPRVLWIGLAGEIERMSIFRNTLQSNLKPFGIKEETRRFNPHLTIGRFRKGTKSNGHLDELLLKYKDLRSPAHTLGELVLFKSDLKPSGAVYTKLNAWPLVG